MMKNKMILRSIHQADKPIIDSLRKSKS